MTQIVCILVLVLMSNYVAYTIGRERGLWRGFFNGRAEAFREIEKLNDKIKQEQETS